MARVLLGVTGGIAAYKACEHAGDPMVDTACGGATSSPRAKAGSFAAAFALGFEVPPRAPSFVAALT